MLNINYLKESIVKEKCLTTLSCWSPIISVQIPPKIGSQISILKIGRLSKFILINAAIHAQKWLTMKVIQ